MANHEEARVKLKNAEQNELKSEAKSNTRKTLKITKKLSRWIIASWIIFNSRTKN